MITVDDPRMVLDRVIVRGGAMIVDSVIVPGSMTNWRSTFDDRPNVRSIRAHLGERTFDFVFRKLLGAVR